MLLVTASLLIRTFVSLRSLDPGFDPANLATASVSLQDARYGTVDSVARLVDASLERVRATPGIESAAVSLGSPYERLLNMGFLWQGAKPEDGQTANVGYVSDRYFETLRVPIRLGRPLLDTDRAGMPPVVVVNETFARLYSKDQPAIGRRLRLSGVEREVVGIAGDVQQKSAGFVVEGMTSGPILNTPTIYLPVGQTNDGVPAAGARVVPSGLDGAVVVAGPRRTGDPRRDRVHRFVAARGRFDVDERGDVARDRRSSGC